MHVSHLSKLSLVHQSLVGLMVNGAELGREDMCAELGAESGDFRRNLVMKVVT
jgi:hypothetical protein